MRPKVDIARNPSGGYQLGLEGEFLHPHWVAFLFSGLSANRVSVVSGTAQQRSLATWSAAFQLDFTQSPAIPEQVDYLGLTDQEQLPLSLEVPTISTFQVLRRGDESLEVRVQAPDQLGFLGRFLGKLCMLGLFPVEMAIDTPGGRIQDSLVFRGIAGLPPNEATRQRLESVLQGAIGQG
jgi:hypothetical protein